MKTSRDSNIYKKFNFTPLEREREEQDLRI